MGFAQFTFRRLPHNVYKREVSSGYIFKGVTELKRVFNEFRQTKRLKRFLMSFFFFNTGVQTVMLMAVVFAKKEINWGEGGGDSSLIVAILLIQILGAAGAYLMSFILCVVFSVFVFFFFFFYFFLFFFYFIFFFFFFFFFNLFFYFFVFFLFFFFLFYCWFF